MKEHLSESELTREQARYAGTGGSSESNRVQGFEPAFLDMETGNISPSCFADGRPASVHLLDGLPDELVSARDKSGHVVGVKPSVVAGFVRRAEFFTREQAAQAVCQGTPPATSSDEPPLPP